MVGVNRNPENVKGLIKNLNLQGNVKYMMSINIQTGDGLVNGATCFLKRIDYGRREVGTKKLLRL